MGKAKTVELALGIQLTCFLFGHTHGDASASLILESLQPAPSGPGPFYFWSFLL